MRFVNWLLDVRGSMNIRRFKLECSRYCDFHPSSDMEAFGTERKGRAEYLALIHQWISTAIGRNVVELDLNIKSYSEENYFVLPDSLFVCESLEVLKIGPSFIIRDLPKSGNFFPSLKFLDVSVDYPDNGSVEKIFRHFPLLEDLSISGFLGEKEDLNVNISAPTLNTLRIYLQVEEGDHEKHFYIEAPDLENLDLKFTNVTLETPNSLLKAEANVSGGYAIALPEGISNVKYLCLRDISLEGCSLATFDNLKHLTLCLCDCNYGRLLNESLEWFPKLEHLGIEYWSVSHEELCLPEFVPFCLLSQLKTISIKGFEGYQIEMEAAEYLLKNARVLEKMTMSNYYLPNRKEVLYEEFLRFERGSVNCQVEFVERK